MVDSYAVPDDADAGLTIRIGGRSVVEEIARAWPWRYGGGVESKCVYAALGDERFDGDLDVFEGSCGYSEWTPADPAELKIGAHDLFRRLSQLDGQSVTLWIADEPVNVLA